MRRSRSCENVFFVERGLVRFFGEKRFGEIFGGKRFGEILRGKKTAAIRSTPFSSLPLESSSPPPFHLIRPPNAHLDLGEEQPLRLEAAGGGRLLAPPARGVRGRRQRFERRETTTAIVVELERRAELEQVVAHDDLVARGITEVAHLGAQGGSNGGLLIGIMLTKYPELFGALVCQVPLLDMKRFHLLLAGASWVAEYGDPDSPQDWEFISEYSPYQNISAAKRYPPVLVTTSTRDDRVHPGHARKMTAALEETGHPVWYYENIEGGHAGAADNAQTAYKSALCYSFLLQMLDSA